MRSLKIVFFGKKNEITARQKELLKRINFSSNTEIIPLPQAGIKAEVTKIKKIEADIFWKKFDPKQVVIVAFDEHGKKFDSLAFAAWTENQTQHNNSKELVFVIGGAYGIDQSILDAAQTKLSFGSMVWTRNLFRTMALEQLYRAFEINRGKNFHKS
jgi:23S rRNA (pseudouridine1915-N3)-methyltransferase